MGKPFHVGDEVEVISPKTGEVESTGVITGFYEYGVSYKVCVKGYEDHSPLTVHRKFLSLVREGLQESGNEMD